MCRPTQYISTPIPGKTEPITVGRQQIPVAGEYGMKSAISPLNISRWNARIAVMLSDPRNFMPSFEG
jgi:hypothetical protein